MPLKEVMDIAVKTMNLVKNGALKSRLLYHSEIRWLFRGKVLAPADAHVSGEETISPGDGILCATLGVALSPIPPRLDIIISELQSHVSH